MVKVTYPTDNPVTGGMLCVHGRFGYGLLRTNPAAESAGRIPVTGANPDALLPCGSWETWPGVHGRLPRHNLEENPSALEEPPLTTTT